MKTVFNISQRTYEALLRAEGSGKPYSRQDVADLLRAYENAIELLDDAVAGDWALTDAKDFLYLETGEPRIHRSGA